VVLRRLISIHERLSFNSLLFRPTFISPCFSKKPQKSWPKSWRGHELAKPHQTWPEARFDLRMTRESSEKENALAWTPDPLA